MGLSRRLNAFGIAFLRGWRYARLSPAPGTQIGPRFLGKVDKRAYLSLAGWCAKPGPAAFFAFTPGLEVNRRSNPGQVRTYLTLPLQSAWPHRHTISIFFAMPSQWGLQYFAFWGGMQEQAAFAHFFALAIVLLCRSVCRHSEPRYPRV